MTTSDSSLISFSTSSSAFLPFSGVSVSSLGASSTEASVYWYKKQVRKLKILTTASEKLQTGSPIRF